MFPTTSFHHFRAPLDIASALRSSTCQVGTCGTRNFACLCRLKLLVFAGNEIESLPEGLGNCYRLETLDASCNVLSSVPEELTYCTRLMELNLGGNRLQALPEAIGRLSRVVSLNVSDNALKDLPISIGYCASLAQIGQGVNIDRNPLTDQEMPQQYRIGADRLYMYLEKRMFIVGSPQLPVIIIIHFFPPLSLFFFFCFACPRKLTATAADSHSPQRSRLSLCRPLMGKC